MRKSRVAVGRKITDERETRRCLAAAKRAGVSAGEWARARRGRWSSWSPRTASQRRERAESAWRFSRDPGVLASGRRHRDGSYSRRVEDHWVADSAHAARAACRPVALFPAARAETGTDRNGVSHCRVSFRKSSASARVGSAPQPTRSTPGLAIRAPARDRVRLAPLVAGRRTARRRVHPSPSRQRL